MSAKGARMRFALTRNPVCVFIIYLSPLPGLPLLAYVRSNLSLSQQERAWSSSLACNESERADIVEYVLEGVDNLQIDFRV